ncbi:MAG: transglutaminase-like domain-containing protein [Candidatus Loosdrechtia sp.]|uniref:transglutaminase-like domain-containing protein n=1 Tax=Candidatus Loosdrechtia sp. TaxID=3101272 RepID=UPI003A68FF9A|nr:MAG: transglutaminase-like domain-containing protein [Candidatus Jettenia sp. AMX2]
MDWRMAILISGVVCTLAVGCGQKSPDTSTPLSGAATVKNVVTADIQAAIENHVEEQTRIGEGYFRIDFGGSELLLKLIRVHTEYLANLGPRLHFACVDLVDSNEDVYDVDFFLEGEPGSMVVTETIVHKINGKPLYTWKQKRDGTWHTVPVKDAPKDLLGVITGYDTFEFVYRTFLPEMADSARMWLPMPVTDKFQTVKVAEIKAPGEQSILEEPVHGNRILFLKLTPEHSNQIVEIRFHVQRIEKTAYEEPAADLEKYLQPDRLVPISEEFRTIADKVTRDKKDDLEKARALYNYVIDQMRYMKYGKGWGSGNAIYACDTLTGNCTEFHSFFIALSRAAGIPARFSIGAAIPSERNEGRISGYHCWAEFYAGGKWWPVDLSEANKHTNLASYYFGHHPANRFEFSSGRDLVVTPGPVSGPINFLAYPVLEIGEKTAKAAVEFSFNRSKRSM